MSRRSYKKWGISVIDRYIRNGRGMGDLDQYKPWITIYDFPSDGRVVRALGATTGRIHHLLSQLEFFFFLMLDANPLVEDIKEQFPLPLSSTLLIAEKLKIKHPYMHGTPYVMTTDFYYKESGVWHAAQIKPSAKLNDPRVQEKFTIERTYYEKIGVDWCVLTENELPITIGTNYRWLITGESLEKLIPNKAKRDGMVNAFLELYKDTTIPFHLIVQEMDRQCMVKPGTTMQLFKNLVANGEIQLDLLKRIHLDDPRISSQFEYVYVR